MKAPNLLLLSIIILFSGYSYSQQNNDPFSELDKTKIKTGFLYDKVKLPMPYVKECNGTDRVRVLNSFEWRTMYDEMAASSLDGRFTPYTDIKNPVDPKLRTGRYTVGILNVAYNAFLPGALENDLISVKDHKIYTNSDSIYIQDRVFGAALIASKHYTGRELIFDFSENYYFSNDTAKVRFLEVDFDDGEGPRRIRQNETISIHYPEDGVKRISLSVTLDDQNVYTSQFEVTVSSPKMPAPNETWTNFTADIAYLENYAVGDVGIFFGSGNTDFTRPVIIVDGFDPGNSRDLADIWDIANQESMVTNLLAEGYDFVILNFYGGDDYIQKNAFLFVKLIQQINSRMIAAGTWKEANQTVVIGPSMGGLITRYAITYMEQNEIDHHVRNWISFDSPMKGADIPLGLQHWVRFFAEVAGNQGAQTALNQLSGPAAKQMLIYHYTATTGSLANPNALFTSFYNELNGMGFPQDTRIVAIANGAGDGFGQPFYPGDQIINYSYRSLFINLDGNVWAVNDNYDSKIFNGLYSVPFTNVSEDIFIKNTLPYDGAPGGYRSTLKELADTPVPYGDITAPWDNHTFIPTISSLCILNTTDPYFVVAENLNQIQTPFDKLYFPMDNQEHVKITPESYNWFFHEVINFTPVFTSTPVTTILEDSEYTYTLTSEDDNEWNVLNYEILTLPEWLGFDPQTGIFSGTALNEHVGNHGVSVKVSDGLDESVQSFSIEVVNTNDPPVITSVPSNTADEDVLYTYQMMAYDEDPTNDPLTLSAVSLPDWLAFDTQTGTLSGTPLNEDVGIHNVTLRVFDGIENTEQSFTISVQNTNDPPVITSEPLLTICEDSVYSYLFTATDEDPGGDVLTFNAETLPEWLSFDPETGILTGIPLNEHVGTHEVSLLVNDGTVDVLQNFTITVINTNDPPVIISEPPLTILEDYPYSYQLVAIDEDLPGDMLYCTAFSLPYWLYFDPTFAILSGMPLNENVGDHEVSLVVNDGTVDVYQNFTITVINTNDPPVLSIPVPNQTTQADIPFEFVFDIQTFTDPDVNDVISYQAGLSNDQPLPAWLSFNSDERRFWGTPSEIEQLEIVLKAEDSEGAYATDTFFIFVEHGISVPDVGERAVILIYPNPASDFLTISSSRCIVRVEIYDMAGRLVSMHDTHNERNVLLKPDILPGFYVMKFILENGISLQKLRIR